MDQETAPKVTVVYEVGEYDYDGLGHRALFVDRAEAEKYVERYGPAASIDVVPVLAEAPDRIAIHSFTRMVHRDGSFGSERHRTSEYWSHEIDTAQWTTPGRHNVRPGPDGARPPVTVVVDAFDEQEGRDALAEECHRLSALAARAVEGA